MMARVKLCLVLQYWADKAADTLLSLFAKVPVKNRFPVYQKEKQARER